MGVFSDAGMKVDQIDEAKPIENTRRLKDDGPGLYVLQLTIMRIGTSKNEGNGTDGWPSFQVEFTVLDNTRGLQVGASRSWGQLINNGQSKSNKQEAERQLGDCKVCIAAAMGFKKDKDGVTVLKDDAGRPISWKFSDVKASHFDVIENNPLKFEGRKMIGEVGEVRKTTKTGGRDFTPVAFRPYTEEEAARISNSPATRQQTPASSVAAQTQQKTPEQVPKSEPAQEDSAEW